MTKNEIKKMVNTCNNYYSCALCPYNPEDISRFIGDRWKGGCPDYDRKLVYAMGKGYGNVSEYEAERKMLGSQIKVLKQRLNDKYIEVDNLNRDYSNAFERLKSQQQEINALKEKCEELRNKMWDAQDDLDCYYDEMPTRINQAVQDFAEKLKEKARGLTLEGNKGAGFYIGNILLTNDIDELLKEYE